MKRLRKLNDAARLHELYIDAGLAMNEISNKDPYFKEENIIKDTAAAKYAYWGVISDDGKYLVEAYVYNNSNKQRQCAYVIAPIIDNNGSYSLGKLQTIIYNIENMSEIRNQLLNNGLSVDGTKLTFDNEYASMDMIENDEQSNIASLNNKRLKV